MGAIELTPQMIVVLGFLALTIYMFVSEIVRVDVTAITIMILLGITNLFKPGIVVAAFLFSGAVGIVFLVAVLTAVTSRLAVRRTLQQMD